MHNYCILLFLFSLSLSCLAANSNTFANDADYQKLSPSPTYFIEQGGYADENNVMWVDSAGILRWIGADNLLRTQNLLAILPSFDFTCTKIKTTDNYLIGSLLLFNCDANEVSQQDFFFCFNYLCNSIKNATRSIKDATSSTIAFAGDRKGTSLVFYNTITNQQSVIYREGITEVGAIGDSFVIQYSTSKYLISGGGIQTDQPYGLLLNLSSDILILFDNRAIVLQENTTGLNFVSFPVNSTNLSLEGYYELERYTLIRFTNINNSQLVLVAYIRTERRFVHISCPNDKTRFLNWDVLMFNNYGAYELASAQIYILPIPGILQSINCQSIPVTGTYPFGTIHQGETVYFYSNSSIIYALTREVFSSLTFTGNPSSVKQTTMPFCSFFSNMDNSKDLVFSIALNEWNVPEYEWSTYVDRSVDSVRSWITFPTSTTLMIQSMRCTTDEMQLSPQSITNPSIPLAQLINLEKVYALPNTMVFYNDTLVVLLGATGPMTKYENTRYLGKLPGNSQDAIIFVSLNTSAVQLDVVLQTNITSLRTVLTGSSLNDIYAIVNNDVLYIGSRNLSGQFREFVMCRDMAGVKRLSLDHGYNQVFHSNNNRMLLVSGASKSGLLYDYSCDKTFTISYNGTASTTFGFASKSGIAAYIPSPRKMAVYMSCDSVDDCKAVDSLTYPACVNNICQYLTCPVHAPFLCTRVNAAGYIPCSSSMAQCFT